MHPKRPTETPATPARLILDQLLPTLEAGGRAALMSPRQELTALLFRDLAALVAEARPEDHRVLVALGRERLDLPSTGGHLRTLANTPWAGRGLTLDLLVAYETQPARDTLHALRHRGGRLVLISRGADALAHVTEVVQR